MMEGTRGFRNSFKQKVIPSYYFAERPSSDSGLSLSDASDDDAGTTSPGGADTEASDHLYENVSFSSSKRLDLTRDKRDRDVTPGISTPTFPEPPLNFRDFGHRDWISDNEEDNIGEDNVTEGYHNGQDDFDNATNIITTIKTSAAPPGFSVQTLKKKKVSRHNFVAHYRDEERRGEEKSMIVSDCGTVRGIRHRVSQIKMGIMDSLSIGIDDRTLYKQSLSDEEDGRCVIYLTSLGVIRDTQQRCSNVSKILRNLFVRVVEKDLYLSREYKTELERRLDCELSRLRLPLVFLHGSLLGDEAGLVRLNETGELRRLLSPLRDKAGVEAVCRGCGGCGHQPCPVCGGSRVTTNMWHGSVKLRCTVCDMSGLVRCPQCQ